MSSRHSSKARLVLVAAFLAGLFLAGCSKGLTESDVSYAGPVLDNILEGIAERDYEKFSRDFSERMKEAVPPDDFDAMVTTLETRLGTYAGRSFTNATQTKSATDLVVVTYQARYAKESAVTIRMYFSAEGGSKLIEGFLIDSPALQEK